MFSGGRPEACDLDLRATALREATEEMGISEARILGRLSSMPLYTSNYRLEPYVGAIDSMKPKADGNELVRVLEVSMREILGRSHINALAWDNHGERSLSPVFELEDRIMFGATAYVLYEFVEFVGGCIGAADARDAGGPLYVARHSGIHEATTQVGLE